MKYNDGSFNGAEVNWTLINDLLLSDMVAQFVFQHLATRKNNATKTLTRTYENLLKDQKIKREEITKCWQELQLAGCGTYKKGAGGKKSRFEWTLETREFCGQAILAL